MIRTAFTAGLTVGAIAGKSDEISPWLVSGVIAGGGVLLVFLVWFVLWLQKIDDRRK